MFNSKLKMGIAHGSVTAGFIGYLRPSFDLWGQPMITAARLEQFCPPGTLLMCERAKKLLNESNLHCDYFGKISNKDQTLINTFQLHTIKQPSSRTQ
jgi:guanylate cyclase